MLHFFAKNQYLVDQLEGFVDIHNHILPGIDDGAQNVGESLSLLRAFGEIGITDLICTPHIMHNYHDNTPETIEKAHKQLMAAMDAQKMQSVNLKYAAEHLIDSNFESLLEHKGVVPILNRYLLVEMSFLQPSINFSKAIQSVREMGLFPILAHPERYGYLKQDRKTFKDLKKNGIKLQLNLLSIAGYYGNEVKKKAFFLLKNGLADYFGSDVHNLSQIEQLKQCRISNDQLKLIRPILETTTHSFY